MPIGESKENYLEAIYVLSRRGSVRAVDVAEHLGFSKASVSIALKELRSLGLVFEGEGRSIRLTAEGEAIAAAVNARHEYFARLLSSLGVAPETARADAARLSHAISDESFRRLAVLV